MTSRFNTSTTFTRSNYERFNSPTASSNSGSNSSLNDGDDGYMMQGHSSSSLHGQTHTPFNQHPTHHSRVNSRKPTRFNSYNNNNNNNNYNNRINNSNNNISDINSLFTRERPLLPAMSQDSLLSTNVFSTRVAQTRNIIEWLDEQDRIFDKIKTGKELEIINNEIESVFKTVHIGIDDLELLLKNQTHSFKQDKAILMSLKKQNGNTETKLRKLIQKSKKFIHIRQQREKLFANAKKSDSKLSRADEVTSLNSSLQIADQALEIANGVIKELWHQKSMLTQTKNKLLNMTNLVGFSNSLIRVITQRSKVDQWILIGGMLLTLFIIFLIWWFLM